MNQTHVLGAGATILGLATTASTLSTVTRRPQILPTPKNACERKMEAEAVQANLVGDILNALMSVAFFVAAAGYLVMNDTTVGMGACGVASCMISVFVAYVTLTPSTGCITEYPGSK